MSGGTGDGRDGRIVTMMGRRWRAEFPYHWDADDLVSRRELLQFAVYASGSLFSLTALLAILGWLRHPQRSTAVQPIARAADVPAGSAVYFNYPAHDDQAMLVRLPTGLFVAYSQKCTHLSCAVYYQPERGRLYCPCHEGVFNPETGDVVAGPPQRRLPQILLRQEGDTIYAVGREA
ncbi:MAG TPA: Rieske 2Fe-2S domain-containing protein [Thermomicrobiales bacterium]|nr:Rieske 2Fe-2S domain-containing protein [Thermomicrobiales bacterium]